MRSQVEVVDSACTELDSLSPSEGQAFLGLIFGIEKSNGFLLGTRLVSTHPGALIDSWSHDRRQRA